MINVDMPLELDDGTPCKVLRVDEDAGIVQVEFFGYYMRDEDEPRTDAWWYRIEDGIFDGGDKLTYLFLRNRYEPIPDVFEDYFV